MKILFLTDPYPNYIPVLLLHGLRKILGPAVVEYPKKDCLYAGVIGLGICPEDQLAPGWFPADNGEIDRDDIEKKIKQLQEYEGCPDMSHEKQLLATYKYILSSPFDRKFGGLPPDGICGMLLQNGLSESNLPYQNYEGILQGRETVMYELATGKNGEKYLQPADQVKLNAGMSGISMDLISRFPAKEIPLPNLTESIQVSEKKEKLSIPKEPKKRVRKEKSKVKSVKIK